MFNPNLYTFKEITNYDKFVRSLNDEFEIKYLYFGYDGYDIIYENSHLDIWRFIKYNYNRIIYVRTYINLLKAIDKIFTIKGIL